MVLFSRIPNFSQPSSLAKHLLPFRAMNLRCHRITTKTNCILNFSSLETLCSPQKEQISLYVDTLLQWNQRLNLTAAKEVDVVMEKHIQVSLSIIPPLQRYYISHCCSSCENIRVLDVGSGAGFPGMVLAIACPGWRITLLDSLNKRCDFLECVTNIIGLSNVEVVRGRAEDLGNNTDFRESYDVAVARAVAEMRILAEYCIPFVRVGGLFVASKGHDPQEEVRHAERAIKTLGASILHQCSVHSHGPSGPLTAVVCFKDRSTPKKYPRDAGILKKKPL